jgi:predicted amidohydrolase
MKRHALLNIPRMRAVHMVRKDEVTLGLVQMSMTPEPGENLEYAVGQIEKAARRGAQIVCLPELFTTEYFAQYNRKGKAEGRLLDTIPGRTTAALGACAEERGVVIVGGSIYERAGRKLYNTSFVIDEKGRLMGKYRKTHVPHDEFYYEQSYFTPGDTGFRTFDTPHGRLGLMICYDQWFPEAARVCALDGAEMLFYPTAIGTVEGVEQVEGKWQEAWENVMRGHAIANSVVVAAVNRVGVEDKMDFWGGSFVIDAFGKTLVRAGDRERIVLCTVDLEHGRTVRSGWRFFPNRRPECYGRIVERPARRTKG